MRPFHLWKLRTMAADAERDTGEVMAQPDDPRLTPIGGALRRLRLDELPQLANVLNGTMSLVGPRPERPGFVPATSPKSPATPSASRWRPGSQVSPRSTATTSPARRTARYDLAYMANWSLWLDLSLLFRTIKIVLTSRGD